MKVCGYKDTLFYGEGCNGVTGHGSDCVLSSTSLGVPYSV